MPEGSRAHTGSLTRRPGSTSSSAAASPTVQTVRWVLRPIAFMESARERFGEAFSVRFVGFERPMVMLAGPEALRALYTGRGHGLPPGRTFALRPLLGA